MPAYVFRRTRYNNHEERKEAEVVEFALTCPNDGQVELSLEDISAIAFRDPESVDIMFTCPRCGASLKASLHVPNLLMAALEIARAAEAGDLSDLEEQADVEPAAESPHARMKRERLEESYCEYFRRQLARVRSVDDLLAEIDSR